MNNADSAPSHCPCAKDVCPLSSALAIIGGKWKIQIICALAGSEPVRFNELKKKLRGISNTVLTAALRDLEEKGLVYRKQYLEVPPRVEYSTADICKELLPLLNMLARWGRAADKV